MRVIAPPLEDRVSSGGGGLTIRVLQNGQLVLINESGTVEECRKNGLPQVIRSEVDSNCDGDCREFME